MIFFLLIFLTIYGLFHLYVFIKIKFAFTLGAQSSLLIILFMILMIMAPIIVRMSEKYGFEALARIFSHIGYTWMGLVFIFICTSLLVDIYRFAIHKAGTLFQMSSPYLSLSPQSAFFISLLATVIIALYGYFEAGSIQKDTVTIENPKIPKEIGEITIAQISDIHLGLIVRHERLKRILRVVKEAEPDILISTGDLVDGQICNLTGLAELFHPIDPKYGKFAITGNHEFYAGLDQALRFTEKAGFQILRGENVTVADVINIVGIDDWTGKRMGLFKGKSEKDILSTLSQEKFTLLLKHTPLVDKDATGLFDLQLSGHTHKGQIFPFNLIIKLIFPADAGLVYLNNNSCLYINRGSGTWGPPIRFLSPPEVTIIKLVHEDKTGNSGPT